VASTRANTATCTHAFPHTKHLLAHMRLSRPIEPFMDTELRRTHWQSQLQWQDRKKNFQGVMNGFLQISFWERISLDLFFCFKESQRENEASLP